MSSPNLVFNPFTQNLDYVEGSGGGGGDIETITGNDTVLVVPSGNNVNVVGSGISTSGVSTAGNIYTTGSGSTLTINETQAQFITNYTSKAFIDTPYSASLTDYYISINSSGGVVVVKLPNAPTTGRLFVVKDRSGNSGANHISVTTVGGAVLLDGSTSYSINVNYESASFLFNGTSYEVF
jgi:hypothetical protein